MRLPASFLSARLASSFRFLPKLTLCLEEEEEESLSPERRRALGFLQERKRQPFKHFTLLLSGFKFLFFSDSYIYFYFTAAKN